MGKSLVSCFLRHSVHTCIHAYIQTLDNAHNSEAQGLNLRRGRSLGGSRTVDINDEQTDGFLDEIWMSWKLLRDQMDSGNVFERSQPMFFWRRRSTCHLRGGRGAMSHIWLVRSCPRPPARVLGRLFVYTAAANNARPARINLGGIRPRNGRTDRQTEGAAAPATVAIVMSRSVCLSARRTVIVASWPRLVRQERDGREGAAAAAAAAAAAELIISYNERTPSRLIQAPLFYTFDLWWK